MYTIFPRKEARASISYRGLFVVKIQHKNIKKRTNWDSNPSPEGSKIITLTKRTIQTTLLVAQYVANLNQTRPLNRTSFYSEAASIRGNTVHESKCHWQSRTPVQAMK